jgi:predicted permease
LDKLTNLHTGYDTQNVAVINVKLPHTADSDAERFRLFRDLVNAVRDVPGVEHAAGSFVTPISDSRLSGVVETDVQTSPRDSDSFINFVTPGWFATYGITLQRGRDFATSDGKNQPEVAIVNDAFARRFFPDRNPIAETVKFSFNGREFSTGKKIVGVVSDAVYQSLRDGMRPTIYMPLEQWNLAALFSDINITIRTHQSAVRTVSDTLTAAERDISFTLHLLEDQLNASITQERTVAKLSGWFGMIALSLASIGLYGVLSYNINRRRREIGVRMALGATTGDVIRIFFQRALVLLATGIAIGAAASSWASGFVASLLYGIAPGDMPTLVTASVVLAAVGVVAVCLAVFRSSRIDPAVVLRSE